MSFCFLYNIVSENHSVQNSPWGGGGSIASSRSICLTYLILFYVAVHCIFINYLKIAASCSFTPVRCIFTVKISL